MNGLFYPAISAFTAADGQLALRVGQILLQPAALSFEGVDAGRNLLHGNLELVGEPLGDRGLIEQPATRRLAGQGFDAPDAGRDSLLRDDLEEGDVAGARDMGDAAQLHR